MYATVPTGPAWEVIVNVVSFDFTTKVKAVILNEPGLKVAEINVETFKGVVQLSGFVSQAAKVEAVEVARGVKGMKSVKDDMRVK